MIDWIKKEYAAFKASRTIRLAYAQKALAVVTGLAALLPAFRGYLTPEFFVAANAVFGIIANYLRKRTSKKLPE